MIRAFKGPDAKKLFNDESCRKYRAIERVARWKLTMLDEAEKLQELAVLPRTHLEALSRNRKGQHSIRINDQYRLCFIWKDAEDVEIVARSYSPRRNHSRRSSDPPEHER